MIEERQREKEDQKGRVGRRIEEEREDIKR